VSSEVKTEKTAKEKLGQALGRVASGVYVVTFSRDGKADGMLTTWIQQMSFEPPMLVVGVKNGRQLLDGLGKGDKFTVNVLSKKSMDVFKAFAKPYTEGMDRFEGLNISANPTHGTECDGKHTHHDGLGPIFKNCVSYLNCAVDQVVNAGDHSVVVVEVTEGGMVEGDGEPMVHLRASGFQY